jgi:hypothetical protein
VLKGISFESGSPYNIYDPHFTSEEKSSSESLPNVEDDQILMPSLSSSMVEELVGGYVMRDGVEFKWRTHIKH